MARSSLISGSLWQISIHTSREAEDAVAGLLEKVFGRTASIYCPEDSGLSIATVYTTRGADEVRRKRAALKTGLEFLIRCGLQIAPGKVLFRKVPREDWSTSWRKYFKTIEFGAALLIKPSWSKRRPKKRQACVTLDPGLSFGTGQHATTAFCLRHLVVRAKTGQPQSFLDIGTGSGILAIAAVKLGFNPVRAFDNDPVAVRIAQANARKNRVEEKLRIVCRDLVKSPEHQRFKYDLVCANLVYDLLIEQSSRIVACLHPGARLVLAGILASQFVPVRREYERRGLHLQLSDREGEWRSGLFLMPA